MHRSPSSSSYGSSRASSDEFLVRFLPDTSKGFVSEDFLIISDDTISKKYSFAKCSSGERAVHLIPLILIACALVLWWFSYPVELHID
ncbi:hypothetical protein CDL12_04793 [Handroanthus impetiginosus]|uniref:Uncharacterized protein n=1 Tax=Handroanthus impetiginosus TaxID=429701 RepID=A0A2G9HYB8_9LAMI|nr:hypothetical protein CDL12_04793 [Handroanthus impetiginosus]